MLGFKGILAEKGGEVDEECIKESSKAKREGTERGRHKRAKME